jgi:ornithine decarboxylase
MTEINPDMGFDCASINEINEALPLTSRIIYAQPCKKLQDIKLAQAYGITRTVVDSPEEIMKLATSGWKGNTLIRLLVSDSYSKQPFGKKFGAPFEWLKEMYEIAKYHRISMSGFSFHVGSECLNKAQYVDAIQLCKNASFIAKKYGYDTKTIDIGGGFLHQEEPFTETAKVIKKSMNVFDYDVEWIAEPGRFLAAPTHTLYTTVIGKKRALPNENGLKWRITVDESIYGAFSNIPFDHQKPLFLNKGNTKEKVNITIFGRTCDSGDTIAENILLSEPDIGDLYEIPDMGAYTTVTASEFNGFPKAQRIYRLE